MARYIDAKKLYDKVKTLTNPYGKPALDYESGVKVLDMINNTPTADVAPKSEVAKEIFEEIGELASEFAAGYLDGNALFEEADKACERKNKR